MSESPFRPPRAASTAPTFELLQRGDHQRQLVSFLLLPVPRRRSVAVKQPEGGFMIILAAGVVRRVPKPVFQVLAWRADHHFHLGLPVHPPCLDHQPVIGLGSRGDRRASRGLFTGGGQGSRRDKVPPARLATALRKATRSRTGGIDICRFTRRTRPEAESGSKDSASRALPPWSSRCPAVHPTLRSAELEGLPAPESPSTSSLCPSGGSLDV